MKKLLHEQLQDWISKKSFKAPVEIIALLESNEELAKNVFKIIAKKLKEEYIPYPQYPDGYSVHFDDPIDCGVVRGFTFNSKNNGSYAGKFGIILDNDTRLYDVGEFVKRRPKQFYDANKIEIKVGDIVWDKNNTKMKVISLPTDDNEFLSVSIDIVGLGTISSNWYKPSDVTHKEPDSLKNLLNDIKFAREYTYENDEKIGRTLYQFEQKLSNYIDKFEF